MYYPAILCLRNYTPDVLCKGMLFRGEYEIWELNNVVPDEELFISQNGYPIEFYITDEFGDFLVGEDKFGWIEEEENQLREITIDDLNYIFNSCEGNLAIVIEDEGWDIVPKYEEGKIIIKLVNI